MKAVNVGWDVAKPRIVVVLCSTAAFLKVALLVLAFSIAGTIALVRPVIAGTNEDFEAGKKAFRSGDIVSAMAPLRRASEAGHAAAQALYAHILDRSELDEEAVQWFRKSAEQGDPDGQYGLGNMLASGEGVARDVAAARGWIEKAAAQGQVLAIDFLAQSYLTGQLGLGDAERNSPQAAAALKRAADQDFLPAVDALAQAFRDGGYGVTPNADEADRYAQRAREKRAAKPATAARKCPQ